MSVQTRGEARRFPWAAKSFPRVWPAYEMQPFPVQDAVRPRASMTPICRTSRFASRPVRVVRAREGDTPRRRRRRVRGPYAGSTNDWVATAPMPYSAHGTAEPTEK